MNKHTPGPWHIDPIKAHANGNRRIMAEQCTPIAVVPEQLAADARLIAAAPDLLDALNAALDEIDRLYAEGYDEPEWAAQARAAVAKAAGDE